jgi:hypothetical protein
VTAEQRDQVRLQVERTRQEQGKPQRVEDPRVLADLAGLLAITDGAGDGRAPAS